MKPVSRGGKGANTASAVLPLAALVLVSVLVMALPTATALECPRPSLTTNATSIPEDEVLVITMSSPSAYVTGFFLVVRARGFPTALLDETYETNPAEAQVVPNGPAGRVLAITVNAVCAGPPWVSDPVSQNVIVTPGTDHGGGGPSAPPSSSWNGAVQAFVVMMILAPILAIVLHVALANRRSQRCPRCGLLYPQKILRCRLDGTALVPRGLYPQWGR